MDTVMRKERGLQLVRDSVDLFCSESVLRWGREEIYVLQEQDKSRQQLFVIEESIIRNEMILPGDQSTAPSESHSPIGRYAGVSMASV